MKPRVLFVDQNVEALRRLGHQQGRLYEKWDVAYAAGAAEALGTMAERAPEVVVAVLDSQDPGGAALLSDVIVRHPATVRMALVDRCSETLGLRLAGLCHQVHSKSSSWENLSKAIDLLLSIRSQISAKTLQEAVVATDRLPVASELVTEIARVLALVNPEPEELLRLIVQDSALCAKVLQLANGAYFGTPEVVTEPARAARALGPQRLATLLSEYGLIDIDPGDEASDAMLAAERRKSLVCATVAARIAEDRGLSTHKVETARTCGFLHNLGSLLLISRKQIDLLDHGPALGALLVALWGLPEVIVAWLGSAAGLSCPRPPEGSEDVEILSVLRIASNLTREATEAATSLADDTVSDELADLGHGTDLPAWRTLSRSLSTAA